jgi:hypothetical protein
MVGFMGYGACRLCLHELHDGLPGTRFALYAVLTISPTAGNTNLVEHGVQLSR